MANIFEGGESRGEWDGILGFILGLPMVSPCGIEMVLKTMVRDPEGLFHIDIECHPAFLKGLASELSEEGSLNMFVVRMMNLLASHGMPAELVGSCGMGGEYLFRMNRDAR